MSTTFQHVHVVGLYRTGYTFRHMDVAGLIGLALYFIQQFGVALGVGAETLSLILSAKKVTGDSSRMARGATRLALWLIVISGILITGAHLVVGDTATVSNPAFLFKWELIFVLIVCALLTRIPAAAVSPVLVGFMGSTWYALFVLHTLAPTADWMTLIVSYAIWVTVYTTLYALIAHWSGMSVGPVAQQVPGIPAYGRSMAMPPMPPIKMQTTTRSGPAPMYAPQQKVASVPVPVAVGMKTAATTPVSSVASAPAQKTSIWPLFKTTPKPAAPSSPIKIAVTPTEKPSAIATTPVLTPVPSVTATAPAKPIEQKSEPAKPPLLPAPAAAPAVKKLSFLASIFRPAPKTSLSLPVTAATEPKSLTTPPMSVHKPEIPGSQIPAMSVKAAHMTPQPNGVPATVPQVSPTHPLPVIKPVETTMPASGILVRTPAPIPVPAKPPMTPPPGHPTGLSVPIVGPVSQVFPKPSVPGTPPPAAPKIIPSVPPTAPATPPPSKLTDIKSAVFPPPAVPAKPAIPFKPSMTPAMPGPAKLGTPNAMSTAPSAVTLGQTPAKPSGVPHGTLIPSILATPAPTAPAVPPPTPAIPLVKQWPPEIPHPTYVPRPVVPPPPPAPAPAPAPLSSVVPAPAAASPAPVAPPVAPQPNTYAFGGLSHVSVMPRAPGAADKKPAPPAPPVPPAPPTP